MRDIIQFVKVSLIILMDLSWVRRRFKSGMPNFRKIANDLAIIILK